MYTPPWTGSGTGSGSTKQIGSNQCRTVRPPSGLDPVWKTRTARNSERKSALDQGRPRDLPTACQLADRSRSIRQKRLATAGIEVTFIMMSAFLIRADINRVTPRIVGQQLEAIGEPFR